jgi:putative nucleotidyltransferase with HDIG domain
VKIEAAFLKTKLARRIFWLFVVCALLPISILAVVTLWTTNGELKRQGLRSLKQASREEGMGAYGRLLVLESEMRLISQSANQGVHLEALLDQGSEQLGRRFVGMAVAKPGKSPVILFGQLTANPASDNTNEQILSGKTLLRTIDCGQPERCILLERPMDENKPQEGILIAQVPAAYLWPVEAQREGETLCVFDEVAQPLLCPEGLSSILSPEVQKAASGQFEWNYFGDTYEADYWSMFMKPSFGMDHWTIVVSQRHQEFVAPLAQFKRIFLLVLLLALWIVLLLSLVQIRRSLVPLNRLDDGTKRIAAGEFTSRVQIKSGDEFERLAESFNSMAGRIDRQFRLLHMQSEIDRAILSSLDVEHMVDNLFSRLRGLVSYECAALSLVDPQRPTRFLTHISAPSAEGERNVQIVEVSDAESRALMEKPLTRHLGPGDPISSWISPLAAKGMRFFLASPIVVKGRLAAILSIGQTKDTATWQDEDAALVRQVADQFSVALANARLVADLETLQKGTLLALARAVDAKSKWTAGHSERVTTVALKLGRKMGLSAEDLDILQRGGLLHDVGKIGVPNYVLDKPGALTENEMAQMRDHVIIGVRIVEPIPGFKECLPIVRQHHEWYGGGGYPDGVAGEQIHPLARILGVADSYDAMISDRPYRSGMALSEVLNILKKERGKKHDPAILDAFLTMLNEEQHGRLMESVEILPVSVR